MNLNYYCCIFVKELNNIMKGNLVRTLFFETLVHKLTTLRYVPEDGNTFVV
jgi:hypothetical protein